MTKSLKDKSLSAFLWVLIDKLGGSTANFIITIILARLLMPEDFGLVAMVLVFFEISTTFIESGFGLALIREKNISDEDKSTTLIFNIAVSVICYAVLFVAAPYIAEFFEQPDLIAILRVLGINLIIGSFGIVQQAVLSQRIDFKMQTKTRLIAVVISGICAIALASSGFRVWSLVARLMVMELFRVILLWWCDPWKPILQFSKRSFKKLFGFGSILLAEALIDKVFRHLIQILIGKFYSATTLGFFTQANNFCNMAAGNFLQAIQKVTYPVLAKLQDDRGRLKESYRQIIAMSSFFIVPVMVLMGVLAEPLVVTLAGEKWLPSVAFLQLLCIGGAVWHVNSINLDILLVLGRVDLSLRLEIIKKVITAVAIIIGMQFGIYGMVAGQVVSVFISLFINTWYTDKLLHYPLGAQAKDVATTVGFSALAGAAVFFLQANLDMPLGYKLIIGGTVGMMIYTLLHWLVKTKEMQFVESFIVPKAIQFFAAKT
jgi:O-antigen/teichoic acid export membrane protein